MLILSLVVVGAFSFLSLGVDLFPKIDFPTVTITVLNPGATPQEIETEITEKIEEAVNTISGIDELRSTSVEGISQVFVQFLLEKDVDVAFQEVENRVQTVIPDLPDTAEQPTVQKLDTDAAPVLRISVSAPASLREVTQVAKDKIKERLESVNGVGQITMIGAQNRQINVWVDPDKMRSYNITPAEVSNALRVQNLEFPSGRLDEGRTETSVRTVGKIKKPAEFDEIVVAARGDYQVKVKDIGHTEDGAEEIRSEARLNGRPAVTLIVSKQSGQNTVAVAHGIKERLAEIAPTLPPSYQMRIIGDNSIFIENSVGALEEHLVLGSIFASIVVFFFLWSFRSTFIASMAIPTSIISTFALMYAPEVLQRCMPTIKSIYEASKDCPTRPIALAGHSNAFKGFDGSAYLSGLNTPTTVLSGKNDRLMPVQNSLNLADKLPKSKLILLDDCEHGPHIQNEDEVVNLILDSSSISG